MNMSIGPKGQAFVHAQKPAKAAEGEFSPGKRADSVGHRAKAMVAESGDTSPNAIGRAASFIARMDVTVLASQPAENYNPVEEHETGLDDPVDAFEQEAAIGLFDLEPEEDGSG